MSKYCGKHYATVDPSDGVLWADTNGCVYIFDTKKAAKAQAKKQRAEGWQSKVRRVHLRLRREK